MPDKTSEAMYTIVHSIPMYSLVGYQDGRTFHNATLLCLLLTEVTPALYFSGPWEGLKIWGRAEMLWE